RRSHCCDELQLFGIFGEEFEEENWVSTCITIFGDQNCTEGIKKLLHYPMEIKIVQRSFTLSKTKHTILGDQYCTEKGIKKLVTLFETKHESSSVS
ncbi:hypothetical protein VIGAN_01366900, partial [Vigna angularis var. angularis]